MSAETLEVFAAAPPGLEPTLLEEVEARGLGPARADAGGVVFQGGWPAVWRANLTLRGADRVLVRLGAFRAAHLAQLDKRARRLPWAATLPPNAAVRVEASCARSRIYHEKAAAQRVSTAIRDAIGPPGPPPGADAGAEAVPIRVLCRIVDDLCQISVDSSGEPLHKRGFKEAVAKAPLRETMASLLLRACGYDGAEPVLDPMCGSGTFLIEAAEIAAGLSPGRGRSFAFERFGGFEPSRFDALRADLAAAARRPDGPPRLFGRDHDAGAVRASGENAARAGVADWIALEIGAVGGLVRPDGPPGLAIVNPPYGRRIGESSELRALYAALGRALRAQFSGWRVGLLTSDAALARATGLPFAPPGPPLPHGGVRVRLHRTGPLN